MNEHECNGTSYAEPAAPPSTTDLHEIQVAAMACKACHLWECATQTVFGEGPHSARLMLVGEEPGDQEDKRGIPFIGPAGKLLRSALEDTGIEPGTVYFTNAVKHFKWEASGGRRLHKRPTYREIQACFPWLRAELELVNPDLVVCLGSTASQALLSKDIKVTQHRGKFIPGPFGKTYFVTVHPSSILRARDEESRHQELNQFVSDLRLVANYLHDPMSAKVSVL